MLAESWKKRRELHELGDELVIEGDDMRSAGLQLTEDSYSLMAANDLARRTIIGYSENAEGYKLWAHGFRLTLEGEAKTAKGYSMWAEGDLVWSSAVVAHSARVEWHGSTCIVDGEIFS